MQKKNTFVPIVFELVVTSLQLLDYQAGQDRAVWEVWIFLLFFLPSIYMFICAFNF